MQAWETTGRRLNAGETCVTQVRRDLPAHPTFSFDPNRDVAAVAGASDAYWEDAWALAKPLDERRTLVFFAGKLHGAPG